MAKRGRPRKTDFQKRAGRPVTVWDEERALELVQGLFDWMCKTPEASFIDEYIEYLYVNNLCPEDLTPDVLPDVTTRYPAVAKIFQKARKLEEVRLLKQHTNKTVKSIFALKSRHAYRDDKSPPKETITKNVTVVNVKELKTMDEGTLLEAIKKITGAIKE